jgi:hypothetical protein
VEVAQRARDVIAVELLEALLEPLDILLRHRAPVSRAALPLSVETTRFGASNSLPLRANSGSRARWGRSHSAASQAHRLTIGASGGLR